MDLSTITVAQFQAQFFRDFPYLPTYSPSITYAAGATSYFGSSFWNCQKNGTLNIDPGSDSSVWQQVNEDMLGYVCPQDITNAFAEAQVTFNQDLFSSDPSVILAYLYCTAHYLVNDLKTAAQGVNSNGAIFPIASKSVGSVSTSYAIPDRFKDNAQLAFFTSSGYGQKYLSMLLPNLVGNFGAVHARTNP